MDEATKEILFDVIRYPYDNIRLPDFMAEDPQAVDWLFYHLHSVEFPSHVLIDFLGKHFPEERRFLLWKYRAFHPCWGHKGYESKESYCFVEKNEPDHPWLDPFMEQIISCRDRSIDEFYVGREVRESLMNRFDRLIDNHDPRTGVPKVLSGNRLVYSREYEVQYKRRDDDEYHGATLQETLPALDSPVEAEVAAAIDIAGTHLYQAEEIRTRLIAKAREGNQDALLWVAWRYPEDPLAVEMLTETTITGSPNGRFLIVMCLQGICLPELRERFLKSIENSRLYHSGYACGFVLAIRTGREMLENKVVELLERADFRFYNLSCVYWMWFSLETVLPRILEKIASGDLLDVHSRMNLLLILTYTDFSEPLRNGIRAIADRCNVGDEILLLGLLYGHEPQTVAFLKEFVRDEQSMLKSGAEAAFAEVLRLGDRGPEDFQWALEALKSSRHQTGGIADRCPPMLLHFFGTGPQVVEALQNFALSSGHPVLADASLRLLLEKFPAAVPFGRRSAVEGLSFGERGRYLQSLSHRLREDEENLREITHFALHDPEVGIRKTTLDALWRAVEINCVPSGWADREFAQACLQHEELAETALRLLAKWHPG